MGMLLRVLELAAEGLGAVLLGFAVVVYLRGGSSVPLLLALAILVAGPVEDGLRRWAAGRLPPGPRRDDLEALVDRLTSLVLVVLLLLAAVLAAAPRLPGAR